MQSLLAACSEEIAVQHESGTSFEELWGFLEARAAFEIFNLSFPLDAYMKNYLAAIVMKLDNVVVKLNGQQVQDVNTLDFGVYDQLRLFSDGSLLNSFILQHNVIKSDGALPILILIIQSRNTGITAVELARVSNANSKDVSRFVKSFCDMNLVVKLPIIHDGKATSIIIHVKYAINSQRYNDYLTPLQEIPRENKNFCDIKLIDVRKELVDLLESAKNNTLTLADIFYHLMVDSSIVAQRRCLHRQLLFLEDIGVLEKIKVPNIDKNGRIHYLTCYKLLDKKVVKKEQPENSNSQVEFIYNQTLDQQIINLVKESETTGMSKSQIKHALCIDDKICETAFRRTVNNFADGYKIKNKPLTLTVEVFFRQHRHRFFSIEALKDAKKALDIRPDIQIIDGPQKKVADAEKPLNISKISRKNAIMAMLDEEKCINISSSPFAERLCKSLNCSFSIDKKTIMKLADELFKEGKLLMNRIKSSTSKKSVTVIIHKSLSWEDEMVKAFCELCKEELLRPITKEIPVVANIEIDRLAPLPKEEEKPKVVDLKERKWVAEDYGYVSSKCLQLEILHKFLISMAFDGMCIKDLIISSNDLLDNLSVEVFLQIIGLREKSEVIDRFLSIPGAFKTAFKDLDDDVKCALTKNQGFQIWKCRCTLQSMLETLGDLELVSYTKENGNVEILANVKVFDFTAQPPAYIKNHAFMNDSDIVEYWTALRWNCIKYQEFMNKRDMPKSKFSFLFIEKNWEISHHIGNSERSILRSHIQQYLTMRSNDRSMLINRLSKETKLPVVVIQDFFKKETYRHNLTKPLRKPQLNNNAGIPKAELPEQIPNAPIRWTEEEEKRFILGRIILKHLGEANAWRKLRYALPNRPSTSHYRQKLRYLMARSSFNILNTVADDKWPQYFLDKCKEDNLDSSFLSIENIESYLSDLVDYFMKRISEIDLEAYKVSNDEIDGNNSPEISLEDLSGYRIISNDSSFDLWMELESDDRPGLKSEIFRQTCLVLWPPKKADDFPSNTEISTLIKLIALIPDKQYDADFAFSLINKYDLKEFQDHMDTMAKSGVIRFLNKKRRLAGKGATLSDEALSALEGPIKQDILKKAKSYFENMQDYFEIPVDIEQEQIMVLLELIAFDKLNSSLDYRFSPCETTIEPEIVQNLQINLMKNNDTLKRRIDVLDEEKEILSIITLSKSDGISFEDLYILYPFDLVNTLPTLVATQQVVVCGYDEPVYKLAQFASEKVTYRIWNNLHGEFEKNIYDSLSKSVLNNIAQRPGVSLDNLLFIYRKLLCKAELMQVLLDLEYKKAIRQTCLAQSMAATFYFRVAEQQSECPPVPTFNDGNAYGPCNKGQGIKYGAQSKYWAAIHNGATYCGQYIIVRYKDRAIKLQIMDECPGCAKDNHVDMSMEALIELTGSKDAACAVNLPVPDITWDFETTYPTGIADWVPTSTMASTSTIIPQSTSGYPNIVSGGLTLSLFIPYLIQFV